MSPHLSEDQMVALLHGTLPDDARAEARRHLGTCASCAGTLAREAALDEVLWEARRHAPPAPKRSRRIVPVAWLVGVATTVALGYAGAAGQAASGAGRIEMGNALAWQNLIFYIPLAIGVLLVLGSFFSGHGHDGGHDHDAGHGHDAGHEHDGFFARALSLLGVGRVPLTVGLMIAAFLFGGTGVILNGVLAAAGLSPGLYGPIAVCGAAIYTVLLTGQAARLVERFMPATETYSITRQDFAGCTGTLLLPADPSSGYAQVKDREGNVHNVKCRTARGSLAKGTAILIVMYDEETKSYLVDANPV